MKTATVIKLRHAQKFLRAAHEAMVAAIAADPEFAAFAVSQPKNDDVMLLVGALVEINSAGKQLEELINRQD